MNEYVQSAFRKAAVASAICVGCVGATEAAFTPLSDNTSYRMTITGGCFDFGNCQASGKGVFTDNTTPNQANASAFGSPAGSGISNDGFMGVIEFSLVGGSINVTSFSQDSYQGTAGGTFYIRATNLGTMGGSIDSSGNMVFDPTGRQGLAANFASTLGENEWNRDNTSDGKGGGELRRLDYWYFYKPATRFRRPIHPDGGCPSRWGCWHLVGYVGSGGKYRAGLGF